jgi:hypothetical protein
MKSAALPTAMILGLTLGVAGCAQFGLQETALSTPIGPSEIDWARKSGANTVSGIAVTKAGATSHTCAGQSVNLVPDSCPCTKVQQAMGSVCRRSVWPTLHDHSTKALAAAAT